MDKPPTTSGLNEEQRWLWTVNEQDLVDTGSADSLSKRKKKKKKKEGDETEGKSYDEMSKEERKGHKGWRLLRFMDQTKELGESSGSSEQPGSVQGRKRRIPEEDETTGKYGTKRMKLDDKLFNIWRQSRAGGQSAVSDIISVQRIETESKEKRRKKGDPPTGEDTPADKKRKKAEEKAKKAEEKKKKKEEKKKKKKGERGAGDKKGATTAVAGKDGKVDDELKGQKRTLATLEKPTVPVYSGLFNDERRRIDLIMVIEEEDKHTAQEIKAQFLVNMAKLGLEMEFENGSMKRHKDITFVKIHAPEKVLYDNAEWYGVERYFKDKNIDFLATTFWHKLLKLHYEKEWIKLVRKDYQPFRYSNMARSYVVFMLLRDTPFGQPENYVGIERLLEKKIILDAYALHDSSYLYLSEQDYAFVTGRQILFYYWSGVKNILKLQPIHMIHEYYGPKIAFYFAFYEVYIQSMFILAAFGILKTIPFHTQSHLNIIRKDVCNPRTQATGGVQRHRVIAPQCFDERKCPFMTFSDQCFRVKAIDNMDNELFPWYSFYVCLWAVVLPFWWKRKERYLIWAWELFHRPQYIIRTKHYYDYKQTYEPSSWYIMKNYDVLFIRLKRLAIKFFAFTICGSLIFGVVLGILYLKYIVIMPVFFAPDEYSKKVNEVDRHTQFITAYFSSWYLLLIIFAVSTLIVLSILEKVVSRVMIVPLAKMENHRSQEQYEESICINHFALRAYCTFLPLVVFAWLKGPQLLRVPDKNMDKVTINITYPNNTNPDAQVDLSIFQMFNNFHCSVGTCYDEVMILFIVVVFAKIIVARFVQFFKSIKEACGSSNNKNIAEWESEYKLKPITDEIMFDKFNDLAMQFAVVTWFVPIFPLAPAIAMLLNLWHLRYEAKSLVVNSRRPVLFRTDGLGAWNDVMIVSGCSAVFFVVMLLVHQSSFAYERILKNYAKISDFNYYRDLAYTSGGMIHYKKLFFLNAKGKVDSVAKDYYLFTHYKQRKLSPEVTESKLWPYVFYNICRHDDECRSHISEFKRTYNAFTIIIFLLSAFVLVMILRYYITETPSNAASLIQAQTHIRKVYQTKRKKLPPNVPGALPGKVPVK